jgi:polar amino acid transport system substrate-binding protein
MKSHHWIIALCVGILLGIFVFKMTRPLKPSPGPVPGPRVETKPPLSVSDVRISSGFLYKGAEKARVHVQTFWMDRTEVTNGQYEVFLNECPPGSKCGPRGLPNRWEEQKYQENRRDHPVVDVSWDDASAFCRWTRGRLPSADEWERAARGDDQRDFPGGRTPDLASVNIQRQDERDGAPLQIPTWGVYDTRYALDNSPYGVHGMAGNVSEWTADAGAVGSESRMAAGGSWDSYEPRNCQADNRMIPRGRMMQSNSLGFRCAFSSPPSIEGEVLRVASEPETPPMLIQEGNSYDGFDWAIANAIAKRIGFDRVDIVAGKYSELPGRLIASQADAIISGYTADPSIEGVDWSDSYFDYGLCLIVPKGSTIRSIDDLGGKVIGIFNDPAAEADVKQLVKGYKKLEKYEDGYFDLLAEGRLDAFLYDFPYAQEEIKPYGGRLEIVQFNLTESTYNVGVRRGATSLLRKINIAIRELKGSDTYRQIVRRYLGGTEPAPAATVAAGQEIYRVAQGDTLSMIARAHLGETSRWTEIWDLNKDRIADPNLIEIGWELVVPKN